MYPSFYFLNKEVSLYAILGILGVVVSCLYAWRRNRYPALRSHLAYIAVYGMLGAMAGAKILFLITQAGNIASDVRQYGWLIAARVYLMAGFVFYGGLIGGVAACWAYAKYMNLQFSQIMQVLVPVIPLVHAFGRLGCFSAGCCYGIPFDPPVGIAFRRSLSAPNHVHLFPVQLLEALLLFLIFLVLWQIDKRSDDVFQIIFCYIMLYAPVRFGLEFLRGDVERGFVLGVSTSQFISILLFVWAVGCLAWRHRRAQRA